MSTADKHACAGRVFPNRAVRGYPCSNNAKFLEGGQWWCHLHAPSKIAAKREAKYAEWEAAQDRRREARRVAEAKASELSQRLGITVVAVRHSSLGTFDMVIVDPSEVSS